MKRPTVILLAGLAAVILAAVLLRPSCGGGDPPPARPASGNPPVSATPEARSSLLSRALAAARKRGSPDLPMAAADMRRQARQDPDFLRKLGEILTDGTQPQAFRELAAFVLGSLTDDEARRLLAGSLASAGDPAWARVLILALGSYKESGEDDYVFGLPDSPWVVGTSLGLSVRVQTLIEDSAVRDLIRARLGAGSPTELRAAAVKALFHSMAFADAREGFLASLGTDPDAELQAEAAKGLCDWAATAAAGSGDRGRVATAILEQGARPEASAVRFRSEDGLRRMAMTEGEIRSLGALLEHSDLDQRRWAMAVLGAKAAQPDLPAREEIFASIGRIVSGDAEPKMREWAVAALASFPDKARAADLLRNATADSAWHVRLGAARALGRVGGGDQTLATLRRVAQQDENMDVRRAAEESLQKLSGR